MIRVPTYLSLSPINGLGVYSSQNIEEGTLIWSFQNGFDKRMSEDEYNALEDGLKDYLENYSYRSLLDDQIYIPFDNDRYMNHSFHANTVFKADGNFYAARDIAAQEEITCNYKEFNANWEKYAHIYGGECKQCA